MMMMPMDRWEEYWPKARPHIDAACQYGDLSIEDIEKGLSGGYYQLVVMNGGASVFNLNDESLHITAVGGEFDYNWLPGFLDYAAAVAITMNRRRLTGYGRKGWLRKLKPFGWRQIDERYEVDL